MAGDSVVVEVTVGVDAAGIIVFDFFFDSNIIGVNYTLVAASICQDAEELVRSEHVGGAEDEVVQLGIVLFFFHGL